MEINKTRTIFEFVLILSGTLLTLIFLSISKLYWILDPGWFIKLVLSFFIGSVVSGAVGMLIEARSRVGGIFLLAVFLPFAYSFSTNGFLRIDGIVLGLAQGGYLTYYSVVNNRFDRLAQYLRRLIKIFLVFILLYLLIQFISINVAMDLSKGIPQFGLISSSESFKVVVLIGIICAVCFLLMKTVYGIRAYDVFIYGPSRSGKTLLLLAFYNHFINYLKGHEEEFIMSDTNDERLKIENMLVEIESGRLPKSNLRTDLAIYLLSGKKNFKPVSMTLVDYGGEHTRDFKPAHFEDIVEELSKRFNIPEQIMEQNIGNIGYITNLRDNYRDDFAASVDKVTFAHIYKRFERAGKILFLVDGDHVVSYNDDGKNELIKLFGHYSKIIKLFGSEKSYAIVVTKIDQYRDLSPILEDSPEAKEIELNLYNLFCEIPTFKEIVNMAYQTHIHLYTISVDATMGPINTAEETEMKRKTLKINPWRVEEIEHFSL